MENEVEVQNNAPKEGGKKGKSIASLILGIVSFVFSCIGFIAFPSSVIGLILGILGRKSENAKGMATTGIVFSILGFLGAIAWIVLTLIGIGASASEYMYY